MGFQNLLRLSIVVLALATSCHSKQSDFRADNISPYVPHANSTHGFNYTKIANYPDKWTLQQIIVYFNAFATQDADGLNDLEAPGYNITDIPLATVRLEKENWHVANKAFTKITTDVDVVAISLHGSCKPDSFALLENVIFFTLTSDPPSPGQLDPYKKGDRVCMIMLSAIWWDENGFVSKELEYGRLCWPGFDLEAFFK